MLARSLARSLAHVGLPINIHVGQHHHLNFGFSLFVFCFSFVLLHFKLFCNFLNVVDDNDAGAVVIFFVFGSALAMSMHILGKSDQHMPMIVLHTRQTTE